MRVILALLSIPVALFAQAAENAPSLRLSLRLEHLVTTRTAQVGDAVHLRTVSRVVIGGETISEGSYARGVIIRSKRPGRVHGVGEIEIGILSITRPDGIVLPVNATFAAKVPSPWRYSRARPDEPRPIVPILAGMAGGYGTAAVAARNSKSEDTIVKSGLLGGLAIGVAVGVLPRGKEMELYPGSTIDVVVWEDAAPAQKGSL